MSTKNLVEWNRSRIHKRFPSLQRRGGRAEGTVGVVRSDAHPQFLSETTGSLGFRFSRAASNPRGITSIPTTPIASSTPPPLLCKEGNRPTSYRSHLNRLCAYSSQSPAPGGMTHSLSFLFSLRLESSLLIEQDRRSKTHANN